MCNICNGLYTNRTPQTNCGCCALGTLWVFLFGENNYGCNGQRVCRDCNGNLHIIQGQGCNNTSVNTGATTYPWYNGGATTGTANACFGCCGGTTTDTGTATTNGSTYNCGYWRVRTCGCYGYSI